MPRDYYVVLGVSRGADLRKIKQAYRRAVKQHHPDAAADAGSTEKFLEAKDAYETLSNTQARRAYDRALERRDSGPVMTGPAEPMAASQPRYVETDVFASAADEFLGGILPGFFPDFFEKGRGKGKELFLELILTPREAAAGGLFPITVPVIIGCPQCRTDGIWGDFFCPLCRGSGRVRTNQQFSLSIPPHVHDGAHVSVSLDDIGLAKVILNVTVVIDRSPGGFW